MNNEDELEQDVVKSLESGRKIDAIKLLREHRNIGLKEAKDLVDIYIRENPTSTPAVQKTKSSNGLILTVCTVIAAYIVYKYLLQQRPEYLHDGFDCSYICNVAPPPDYQGIGLGWSIIKKLIVLSQGHKKVILYANPGKEGFYK